MVYKLTFCISWQSCLLTPAETMPTMAVNRKGHKMALLYGTYSKCFSDKTTQEWKGLHQWSTQF